MTQNAGLAIRFAMILPLAFGLAGCGQEATAGTGSLSVAVAYADTRTPPAPSTFPSPWAGAHGVRFVGSGPTYNAGAIRFQNPSDRDLHVDRIVVTTGTREWMPWGGGQVIPAHSTLILTQTAPGNFATSSLGSGCHAPSNAVPRVEVSTAGVSVALRDQGLVLSTGGRDVTSCGGGNASHPWVEVGTVPATEEVSESAYRDLAGWALLGIVAIAAVIALGLGAVTALWPASEERAKFELQ